MRPDTSLIRPTVGDFALTVLLLGLCAWAIVPLSHGLMARQNVAQVFEDGRLTRQVDLDQDQRLGVAEGRMTLEIRNGRIRIAQSDCPHQSCRHAGWIARPPETLICVPNHMVIVIPSSARTDTPNAPEVDAIAR